MSVKGLRWLFTIVMAALIVLYNVSDFGTIGISAEWTNGHSRFAGGTALGAIVFALVMDALYLMLMWSAAPSAGQPLPGLFRRFVAFWCDFIFAMTGVAPIVGILSALIDWNRKKIFHWNFVRTTYVAGDALQSVLGVGCVAGALVLYFSLPLVRRRPSPGTCMLGYQVLPQEGSTMSLRTAAFRTLLGLIAIGTWFVAPLVGLDRKKGQFWLDKVFSTHATNLG